MLKDYFCLRGLTVSNQKTNNDICIYLSTCNLPWFWSNFIFFFVHHFDKFRNWRVLLIKYYLSTNNTRAGEW